MEERTSKTEYHINRFMYSLGIKGSTLLIYAALYSFTNGERGLYHGSSDYLAATIDVSTRTVFRAYKTLFSKGLIERCASADGKYVGIRCTQEAIKAHVEPPNKKEEKKLVSHHASAPEEEKRQRPCPSYEDIEARHKVRMLLGDKATEQEQNTFYMMHRYEDPSDHRRFMRFGKEGLVAMTEAQYKRLLDLLPTEELMPYLSRFENMLRENRHNGKHAPHSHYKTLKKWIEEDLEV